MIDPTAAINRGLDARTLGIYLHVAGCIEQGRSTFSMAEIASTLRVSWHTVRHALTLLDQLRLLLVPTMPSRGAGVEIRLPGGISGESNVRAEVSPTSVETLQPPSGGISNLRSEVSGPENPRTCARPRESASQTFVCTRSPADRSPAPAEDDRTSQGESRQAGYLSQNSDWPDPAKASGPHWMLSCGPETLRLVEWLALDTRAIAVAGMYPMETIAAAALRTYQRNRRLLQIGEGELTNRVGFFIHALRNASDLRPPVEEPPPARHSGAHSPPARSASPHRYSRRTAPLEFTPEAVMERMERRNPAMAARMRAAEDPAYQAALEKAWGMR